MILLNCSGREDSRVPWTARSNQSILKEINPEYSLEGLMLRLKLQYFGHLMQTADLLEKTLMLEKTEGERRGQQRMRCLDSNTDSMDMNLGKLWEVVKDREAWHTAVHGVTKSLTHLATEQQQKVSGQTSLRNTYFPEKEEEHGLQPVHSWPTARHVPAGWPLMCLTWNQEQMLPEGSDHFCRGV